METVKWILSQITAQWSLHWICICSTGAGLRLFHGRSCLMGTTPFNYHITDNLCINVDKMSKKEGLKRTKKQANMYERTRIASHSQLHCIFSGAASIVNININSCSALKSVCEKTIWNEFNFGELHRKHSIQYYIYYNIFALTFSNFLSSSTATNLCPARGKLNVFKRVKSGVALGLG